jgi:hypothetical protein
MKLKALLTRWRSAVVPPGWYCTQMAQCTHRAHCTSNQLMMECTNQKAANAVAPSPARCVVTNMEKFFEHSEPVLVQIKDLRKEQDMKCLVEK